MNKPILAVLVVAVGLTAALYSLPRTVVQNEGRQLSPVASRTNGQTDSLNNVATAPGPADPATKEQTLPGRGEAHAEPLTDKQLAQIQLLKNRFAAASSSGKTKAVDALLGYYRSVSRYDSAAVFAGQLAQANPDEASLMRAGDAYFEAYGFVVNEQKAAQLGQQTRAFYQQVLAKNPDQLTAKANMAMTYVSTETPMQGIMLLREVLQADPTNELALFNLGMLAMRSNQMDRAVERFRQILVNDPTNRKARFYLGISLAESGQKAEALKALAQVKATETDPQVLAAVREYEEKLK
jgi:cytochrome c-type biogenesis protein CcmH/NrfG